MFCASLLQQSPVHTSNYSTMLATRRVQARSKDDVLERFFEWSETAFCPHTITNDELPPPEDVLDYLFEHVETFTCAEEADRLASGQPRTLERDNSLIEGYPSMVGTHRGCQVEPLGHEGDMLDVCFEQIEAYACKEGEEDSYRKKSNRFSMRRQRRSVGTSAIRRKFEEAYADLEAQDEIQLYYRPNRSTSD
jgi:hypothetical protein